jgi:hypothetical protein
LRKFGDRIYEARRDFNMSAFPKPLEESKQLAAMERMFSQKTAANNQRHFAAEC